MKIITKYLGTTIATYIFLVMLLLLGLHAFIEFMREFSHVGTGSYGIFQLLSYVVLMLPSDIYQFFPMAGLLGCVIALGLLASHSELIILRTSGLSLISISIAVIKTALILIIMMFIVGEVIGPIAQERAIKNRTRALSEGQALVTYEGVWAKSGRDFVHIDHMTDDGKLQHITKYEFGDDRKLQVASKALTGSYQNGKWIFKDIIQTTFANDKITNVHLSEQQWELALNPNLLGIIHIDTEQNSLVALYSYIKGRRLSGLNVENYEFAFWQRIFMPLATLIMILLAVPFVFGPLRSTTMGLRMFVGVLVGFGFHILNQFVGSVSVVYQVPPLLAAIFPSIIFMGFGWLLLVKTR